MAYVQNNAGNLLMAGYAQQAQYKMAEGEMYGNMLQKMGHDFSGVMRSQAMQRERKEREAGAVELLRTQFGVQEDEAKGLVKSVGAEGVGQFMQAKQQYDINQQELQALQQRAQDQQALLSTLDSMEEQGMMERNPQLAALSMAVKNGAQGGVSDLLRALNSTPPPPVGSAVPMEGGGGRMVWDGQGYKMVKDEPGMNAGFGSQQEALQALGGTPGQVYQDKGSGRWMINQQVTGEREPKRMMDEMVTVRIPQKFKGKNGETVLDYENAPAVRMKAGQAVESGAPGYAETHAEQYFMELPKEKLETIDKIIQQLDDGRLEPAEARRRLVKQFAGNDDLARRFMEWANL